MSRVLVLGAGLTGLSAAYHLARRGQSPVVVEREAKVGGVCRTIDKDGFGFDLTGHLLHLDRAESRTFLSELGVLGAFAEHRRRAAVVLGGTVTPYPIQIHTHRLPAEIRRDCVLGFVETQARPEQEGEQTFAEWALSRFGEGFARHFFFPYNHKLYCADPAELTTEWVGRYVPRPSLRDVIDGAFGLFRGPVGYNASFLYPRRGGIQCLADALATHGPGVRLNAAVKAVCLAAREVELASGERLGWDALVAAVPLSHLASITVDLPSSARKAAASLRSVCVLNLNLGVRGRAPRREHWLYVPEERYPFYRVGFPSNHGRLAPRGCHTVSVEVSLSSGSQAPPDLRECCLDGLEALGLLRDRGAIVTELQLTVDPAYVVYDHARPAALAILRACFAQAGVELAGRWAEWKYSTMEDALWDGAAVAARLA